MFTTFYALGDFLKSKKIKSPDPKSILDARSPDFLRKIRERADELIDHHKDSISDLLDKEREIFLAPDSDIGDHLAIKLALSKMRLSKMVKPLRIGVVVPVFRETIRIRPRLNHALDDSWKTIVGYNHHPNGENFVYEKAKQIAWLLEANSHIEICMIYVDDACDHGTGKLIKELFLINNIANSYVYDLQDVIHKAKSKPNSLIGKSVYDLGFPNDSQKSGSVYAGMAIAIEKHNCDVVVYTDADLSYDLGQIGNLIYPLVVCDEIASVADRRNTLSYTEDVVVSENIHSLGKKCMKAILGSLRAHLFSNILPRDTQAGFKAILSHYAKQVIEMKNKDNSFAFDVQFLARLNQVSGKLPTSIATVCIDSPEETTADGFHTYQMMARIYIHVLNELKLDLNDSQKMSCAILDELSTSKKTWDNLLMFMGSRSLYLSREMAKTRRRLQKYFSGSGNNTAASIKLEDNHLQDLLTAINHVSGHNSP